MLNGQALGEMIVAQVRDFVGRAIATVSQRIDVLEKREPVKGERGEPGSAGERGADGSPGEKGEKGDRGDPGAPGVDGKDGRDGIDGKDGAPGLDGRDGKDGQSVTVEDTRLMIAELVQKAVSELPTAKDGEPGRDALQIEPRPSIEASRSYPRGTYAFHRGGMIFAFRDTDPITAELERAGWTVAMNGVAEETEILAEDGRTFTRTTVYTNGAQMVREHKTQSIIDRGVWKPGTYDRGDAVTWGGSSYLAQTTTNSKPDSIEGKTEWRLMAKRGRDGKDGKDGERGPAGRDGIVR